MPTDKVEAFLEWTQSIFWAGCPLPWPDGRDPDWKVPRAWNERAALGALGNWLNGPSQTGVREELHDGLNQLGWDTPPAAGRRLLSELVWNTVLARFGLTPGLRSLDRSWMSSDDCLTVHVIDTDSPSHSDRTGWLVVARLGSGGTKPQQVALEWVLNAIIFYDVELGLTDLPLYRRRYRKPKEWDPRPDNFAPLDALPDVVSPPLCPKCGAPMVEKANGPLRAGRPFWSCSNYPNCTGTRNWRAALR